jgi:hypothetical protein
MLAAGSSLASASPGQPSAAVASGPKGRRSGVLGATFTLPGLGRPLPDDGHGGMAAFVLTMYAIAAVAVATLLVHGGRVLLRTRKP